MKKLTALQKLQSLKTYLVIVTEEAWGKNEDLKMAGFKFDWNNKYWYNKLTRDVIDRDKMYWEWTYKILDIYTKKEVKFEYKMRDFDKEDKELEKEDKKLLEEINELMNQ